MIHEVKRFDLLTVFKVSFLVYLAVGFLLGILYGLIIVQILSTVGPMMDNAMFDDFGNMGFTAAVTMALFMAIFMAVIWSIVTVIAAGIYNLVSGWVGGVQVELSGVNLLQPMPTASAPPPPPSEVPGA
jgi:hypothetical protein